MNALPISLRGVVAHGDKRGRALGFPTANLNATLEGMAYGVYASQTRLSGQTTIWPSVTSYGTRPTFAGAQPRIETHILDFQGDLYGAEIELRLVAFLRPEMRFRSAAALMRAITRDLERVRALSACV